MPDALRAAARGRAGTLALCAVLALAAAPRLAWIERNQSLWADEAVYLLGAQSLAGLADYELPAARPPALPFLWSLFYRAGLGELAVRVSVTAFALLGVFLLERLGRELYDRRVGLAAAFLLAVFAVHLFLSERVLTDVPALSLWLLVVWLAWRGLARGESRAAALALGPALALLLLVRFAYVLLLPVLALMLLAAGGTRPLRAARAWQSASLGLLMLLPYLGWSWRRHGSPAAAWLERDASVSATYAARVSESYASGLLPYLVQLPSQLLDWPCVLLALAGAVLAAVDRVAPRPGADPRRDALVLAWALGALVATPFAGHNEARFLLPLFPAIFLLAAHAVFRLHAALARRSRGLAWLAVALLLGQAAVLQLPRADTLIARSAGSFALNRRIGEWLGRHAPGSARVYAAEPEISQYYSRRRSSWLPVTAPELESELSGAGPAYLVFVTRALYQPDYVAGFVHGLEPVRRWRTPRGELAAAVYAFPPAAQGAASTGSGAAREREASPAAGAEPR